MKILKYSFKISVFIGFIIFYILKSFDFENNYYIINDENRD